MKKRILIYIVVMFVLCSCGTKVNSNGKVANSSMAYTDMLISEPVTIIIDDYEIVLERYYLEKNTGLGYFEFCFKHDGKKVKANKLMSDVGRYVLNGDIDERFCIAFELGSKTYFVEDSKNELYIYMEVSMFNFDNEDINEFLYLMDLSEKDENHRSGYKTYYFNIQEQDDALMKKYYCDDIYISSLGVALGANYELSQKYVDDLYLIMKDGKKIQVVSDGAGVAGLGMSYREDGDKKKYLWQARFKKSIDYRQIDKIVINGKEIEN